MDYNLLKMWMTILYTGFLCDSAGKESTCNAGELGLIPGLGRSPGEWKGYPLQYSGLENSMDCIDMELWRVRHDWVTFTCRLYTCNILATPWQPCQAPCPWDSPGKNTGVGCHFLLQGIFPTQGSDLRLLHWQTDSLPLSHQGSPAMYNIVH